MTKLRKTGLAVSVAAALVLAGCASTPLYAPQTRDGASGYAEQKLDETHYRVTFNGRLTTSRNRVEDALMLRAAEVTQAAGYSHFVIATRETDKEEFGPRRTSFIDRDPFFFYGPRYGRWGYYDPFWRSSAFAWSEDRNERYVAYADIALLDRSRAASEAEAINAAEVIANLRDKVAPPPLP
jgi:hypothetical protein